MNRKNSKLFHKKTASQGLFVTAKEFESFKSKVASRHATSPMLIAKNCSTQCCLLE